MPIRPPMIPLEGPSVFHLTAKIKTEYSMKKMRI
jgi:hypothetical protein